MSRVELKVWGEHACYTRPENKVERVSYDVMTPSAARGLLEGILWKPRMRYLVREIAVLAPVRRDLDGTPLEPYDPARTGPFKRLSILRNELNTPASGRAAQAWARTGGGYAASHDRAQRHALVLREPAYILRADLELAPDVEPDGEEIVKYLEMFRRRVARGQFHRAPYLGNREFPASFGPPDDEAPVPHSDDLGRMLLDLAFVPGNKGPLTFRTHANGTPQWVKGRAVPVFFRARLEHGVVRVPPEEYARLEATR